MHATGRLDSVLRNSASPIQWGLGTSFVLGHGPGLSCDACPDPADALGLGACFGCRCAAFAESVIHECGRFVGGSHELPAAELNERSVVRFAYQRRTPLVVADLTDAALKSLGLNNDIGASADDTVSQARARAIHGASPRWDGLRCVSRQMNKGFAFAIFE
jgi:hypothetical protein